MLAEALLLAAVAFKDAVDCTVQGYIFGDGHDTGFAQENCATSIRSEHDGDSVVLYSPHIWVRVRYPVTGGHQRFAYQWGKDHASVGGKVYPIDWGYVLKG